MSLAGDEQEPPPWQTTSPGAPAPSEEPPARQTQSNTPPREAAHGPPAAHGPAAGHEAAHGPAAGREATPHPEWGPPQGPPASSGEGAGAVAAGASRPRGGKPPPAPGVGDRRAPCSGSWQWCSFPRSCSRSRSGYGTQAKRRIDASAGEASAGAGQATAGVIMGWVGLALTLVAALVIAIYLGQD